MATGKGTIRWDDTIPIKAYELAKSGYSNIKIAKVLGIPKSLFWSWAEKKTALKYALDKAREGQDTKGKVTLRDYVYQRLTPEVKKVWDRLVELDKIGDIESCDWLLSQTPKEIKQHLFIHALLTSNFNYREACTMLNLPARAYEKWLTTDKEFRSLVQELNVIKGDFFESALVGLVKKGIPSAVIFANETFNKGRGYTRKTEVDINANLNVGTSIDDLGLTLEEKESILSKIREKQNSPLLQDQRGIVDAEFEVKGESVHAERTRPSGS